MKIQKQSIVIANSMLEKAKRSRISKNKFFHFAFAFKKSKLIAIGQNNPEKTNARAFRIAKHFGIKLHYPYLHAETDLISKLITGSHADDSISLVIIRLNKNGQLRNSKPCKRCSHILNALNFNKVYWSTDYGFRKFK